MTTGRKSKATKRLKTEPKLGTFGLARRPSPFIIINFGQPESKFKKFERPHHRSKKKSKPGKSRGFFGPKVP